MPGKERTNSARSIKKVQLTGVSEAAVWRCILRGSRLGSRSSGPPSSAETICPEEPWVSKRTLPSATSPDAPCLLLEPKGSWRPSEEATVFIQSFVALSNVGGGARDG